MIPFSAMLWLVALFFGALGLRRGWKSELLSGGALILALFTILQLDGWLRNSILRFATLAQLFALQAAVLLLIFFLTHSNLGWFLQRPASGASSRRRSLLMHSLGAALGRCERLSARCFALVPSGYQPLSVRANDIGAVAGFPRGRSHPQSALARSHWWSWRAALTGWHCPDPLGTLLQDVSEGCEHTSRIGIPTCTSTLLALAARGFRRLLVSYMSAVSLSAVRISRRAR